MAEELGGEWFPWEDALETYESSLWEQAHGDPTKAQELLVKAAEGDWHEAQYDLGMQSLEAWKAGGMVDASLKDQAKAWFLKAFIWSENARLALAEYWPTSEENDSNENWR